MAWQASNVNTGCSRPYTQFDTGWKIFMGITIFLVITGMDLSINLICGIFHWFMTKLISKVTSLFPSDTENYTNVPVHLHCSTYHRHCILHSGKYANKLCQSTTHTNCSSGCHYCTRHRKRNDHAPHWPFSGSEQSTAYHTHHPSSNHTDNNDVTTNEPPTSNLDISNISLSYSPFRYLTGGIFGHFLLDATTLPNVDPIKEVSSFMDQRSDTNIPVTSDKKPDKTPKPTKLTHDKSRSDNKKLRSDNSKPRSDNSKLRSDNKKLKSDMKRNNNSQKDVKPNLKSVKKSNRNNVKLKDLNVNVQSSAGHHRNRLYLDSGASVNIIFNRGLLGKMKKLLTPIRIATASQPIELKEVSTLHKALQNFPLPTEDLYYKPTAIANLLSFAKMADEYYVICNTQIDDTIYVQSKDDGQYLRFQRCKKHNLYYLDIGQGDVDGFCNFRTIEKGKLTFSQLDRNRMKAVRILQEQCGFPSDHDFIHALECNMILGVNFSRRDVKIANEIYGYSQGAAMGKMKHPRKGQKMDRTTEDVTSPVPPQILKHYRKIHLDMDILFINGVAFFWPPQET